VAETFTFALTTPEHWGLAPEHAPPHPTNVCPEAAAALSVTIVPPGNAELQLFGPTQSSPVGLEMTVPEPPIETATRTLC
jgi:hypothetical protein